MRGHLAVRCDHIFAVAFASGDPVSFLLVGRLLIQAIVLANLPSLISKDILVETALQRVFPGLYAALIREFQKWVGRLSEHFIERRLDSASQMRGELPGYLSKLILSHLTKR